MILPNDELRGGQRPRLCHVPEYATSAGDEAIELAAMAGLHLDEWQQFVLRHSLGERPDGNWAAPTIGLVCPRQNGKNAILEARELAGLFLLGESVIVHSAHEQATASEQFRRLQSLIEHVPEFDRRVLRVVKGKGSEAIELRGNKRILFKTRTGGGARGFSIDCIIFDEAYELPETAISAMVPALSARPNTQRWYTSSAVDQQKHAHGIALTRQRQRGIDGRPGIAFFEWSMEGDDPGSVPAEVLRDPCEWAKANPSFGDRIKAETILNEYNGDMGTREFAVERGGIGDWPSLDADAGRIISAEVWAQLADPGSRIAGPIAFALDVDPGQAWATLSAAGERDDGLYHVGVVDHWPGISWLVARCRERLEQRPGSQLVVDPRADLGALLLELDEAGIQPVRMTSSDYKTACGGFFQAVIEKRLRYMPPQPELDAAIAAARTKPLLDAWKWDRASGGLITPLISCTNALWGARTQGTPTVWNLNDTAAAIRAREQQEPERPAASAPEGQRFVSLDDAPAHRGLFG